MVLQTRGFEFITTDITVPYLDVFSSVSDPQQQAACLALSSKTSSPRSIVWFNFLEATRACAEFLKYSLFYFSEVSSWKSSIKIGPPHSVSALLSASESVGVLQKQKENSNAFAPSPVQQHVRSCGCGWAGFQLPWYCCSKQRYYHECKPGCPCQHSQLKCSFPAPEIHVILSSVPLKAKSCTEFLLVQKMQRENFLKWFLMKHFGGGCCSLWLPVDLEQFFQCLWNHQLLSKIQCCKQLCL